MYKTIPLEIYMQLSFVVTYYYTAWNNFSPARSIINSIGGKCQAYQGGSTLCDDKVGKSVYITARDGTLIYTQEEVNNRLNNDFVIQELVASSSHCRELIRNVLCLYYYPPCDLNGTLTVPVSICPEECFYVQHECTNAWKRLESLFSLSGPNLGFINCSHLGSMLDPLPHCCVDAGITMDISTSIPGQTHHSMCKVAKTVYKSF